MTTTDEIQTLPEEGEIIIATVREVTGHGVYVTLDEYNNMTGFLHISEIATGWIRNIERYVRPKQKAVLKVIRVNKVRGEIDTSLKQVSGEERRSKLIEIKKSDKAATLLDVVQSKLELTDQQVQEGNKAGASSAITHIGAPRYRIVVKAENFKIAEKFLNNSVEKTRVNIEKQHGTFNFVRVDSRKSHTLQLA
jgi:translation initiation factor 2 alpha subunit (eIF-2alpha)